MAAGNKNDTNLSSLVGENNKADIASFLGYKEDGNEWYVYRIPRLKVSMKTLFEGVGMQVFLPTYMHTKTVGGRKVEEAKPKMLDYLFALGTSAQVKALAEDENINPVYRRWCEGEMRDDARKWLTVPRYQMHSLMICANGSEKDVKFFALDEHKLEQGDKVRVIDGIFKGLEGTLVSNKRTGGGDVHVSVSSGLGVRTTFIPEEYLKVLEVSRSSNRFFRKIEAFEKVMDEAIAQSRDRGYIDENVKKSLQAFLFRYSELKGLTHVNNAKLTTCRYVAHVLLCQKQEAEQCLQKYKEDVMSSKCSRRADKRYPTASSYMSKWTEKLKFSE